MLWAPLVGTAGAPGMGFPAPSLPTSSISCDSFAPLHLELLQQLQLIFQRSHFTSTGQGLEVAAVGIWGVSAILSQLFCLFPVIEEQFSQCIRQMFVSWVLDSGLFLDTSQTVQVFVTGVFEGRFLFVIFRKCLPEVDYCHFFFDSWFLCFSVLL